MSNVGGPPGGLTGGPQVAFAGPTVSHEDATRFEALERFLSEGGSANLVPDHYSWQGWGWTLLHFAALAQADDCIRLLVSRGADIRLKTAAGETPLDVYVAVGIGMRETRRLLGETDSSATTTG